MRAGVFAARALTHGAAGRIVSASRRAANLLLDDGTVMGLLPSETPLHPWAVAGAVDPAVLRIGDAARVEGRRLIIGQVSVDLSCLHVVDLSLKARPVSVGAQHAAPLHTEASSLAAMVGLGPGLTPSGDDMIVGCLAALDLIGDADPTAGMSRRDLVSTLPQPLTAHTARLSAQMIEAALEGQYPEPLVRLGETLSHDEPDWTEVDAAIQAVAALGHRSGHDLLAGFASIHGLAHTSRGKSPHRLPTRPPQLVSGRVVRFHPADSGDGGERVSEGVTRLRI